MTGSPRLLAGSAACRDDSGVLLLGRSGTGKSDLLLRLLGLGWDLVADDQVLVERGVASAPPALAGLMEVRGLGIVRLPFRTCRLELAVTLDQAPARLPEPRRYPDLDLPLISVDAGAPSAAHRVSLALDCLQGKTVLVTGAFA